MLPTVFVFIIILSPFCIPKVFHMQNILVISTYAETVFPIIYQASSPPEVTFHR